MSSILLTGGAGYIGSHTCLILLENGFDVFVIDSFVNSDKTNLDKIKIYFKKKYPEFSNNLYLFQGDIRDYALVNKIFFEAKNKKKEIKAVIHFAGLKSVNCSINNPLTYWDNNLNGTISLVKSMLKNKCSTLVFSSSASIYEPNTNELIKENTKIKPNNPYGKTKASIENFLEDIYMSNSNNWKIANLRYFNPVGAHTSGLIGEINSEKITNLFPKILQVALGQRSSIDIFGNDWPSKDGTCIRDYIHVLDLAEGHIKTLNYLFLREKEFININLGTGIGKSVLEVIQTFEKINSVKIPYIFKERRLGDRAEVVADIEFAKNILKWQPKYDLADMCRDAWEFIRNKEKFDN